MSVSIRSCPSCKSLILSDTMQCPSCNQVLKEELATQLPVELPAIARASSDSIPCPDCGEMVRKGLVRCWRCGGFLRQDIASSYQKMQENQREVDYSPIEVPDEASEVVDDDDDDDDGFQLAPGLNLMSETELRDFNALADVSPGEQQPSQATYKLNIPSLPEPTTKPSVSAPRVVGSKANQAASPSKTDSTPAPASVITSKPVVTAPAPLAPAASVAMTAPKPASKPAPEAAPAKPKFESTGDPLLDIALQEANEAERRRKKRAVAKRSGPRVALPGYVLVFCPEGHQIQVEERYRGLTGRCPKCKSFFHVPAVDRAKQAEDARRAAEEKAKASKWVHWTIDSHLHGLDPTKLKLKPGSLEKDFAEVDLGFEPGGLLVLAHGKQGQGLFKGEKNKKKKDELRAEVLEYLRVEKPILDLPASGYRFYEKDLMGRVQVVQPAAYAHESMFAGVAVFGEGRVAVRMPVTDQDKNVTDILFVSFCLTEFREFAQKLEELYDVKELGGIEGVPLKDSTTNFKCHYLDRPVVSLEVTPYHKADTKLQLEISGRKCQACGLVVSEEGRKKEKLGGPAGKSIAKAPCPKCKQKFGDVSLWNVKASAEEVASDDSLGETGGLKSKT